MPMLGQASGGWTESSSALRLLHVVLRNTTGILADDAFTQTNPPTLPSTNVSAKVDTTKTGCLSGSVAFTRPDVGPNYVGGPGDPGSVGGGWNWTVAQRWGFKALGVFINSANGNAFENTPGVASGVGPYVSSHGTFGNALYETAQLVVSGAIAAGTALTYNVGGEVIASKNGYLTPRWQIAGGAVVLASTVAANDCTGAESYCQQTSNVDTVLGVVKMSPDSVQNEVVYDQRV